VPERGWRSEAVVTNTVGLKDLIQYAVVLAGLVGLWVGMASKLASLETRDDAQDKVIMDLGKRIDTRLDQARLDIDRRLTDLSARSDANDARTRTELLRLYEKIQAYGHP
jgi:hypothetical protein